MAAFQHHVEYDKAARSLHSSSRLHQTPCSAYYKPRRPPPTSGSFADDIAALMPSLRSLSEQLHTIMSTYSRITTVDIKITKTLEFPSGVKPQRRYGLK